MTKKIHKLKTDKKAFEASWKGIKPYEIRLDDRNFQVGDLIDSRETEFTGVEMKSGAPLIFTDRGMMLEIVHRLMGYGLEPGWCILSVKMLDKTEDYPDEAFKSFYDGEE